MSTPVYINTAKVLIADLTGNNPNLFYEVGLSHAIGKNVILITCDTSGVPFNLRHLGYIKYEDMIGGDKLKGSLYDAIKQIIKINS